MSWFFWLWQLVTLNQEGYISMSIFVKFVHLVSFLITDGNSTANLSLSFFQDRPIIFVSFNFKSNACFVKVWSVSFTNSFPSKVGSFQCHLQSLKPASWNILIAVYFNYVSSSKFSPPVNRQHIDHSLFQQLKQNTLLRNCVVVPLMFLLIWRDIGWNLIEIFFLDPGKP